MENSEHKTAEQWYNRIHLLAEDKSGGVLSHIGPSDFIEAMELYSAQQVAELKEDLNKADVSYAQMRSKTAHESELLKANIRALEQEVEELKAAYHRLSKEHSRL